MFRPGLGPDCFESSVEPDSLTKSAEEGPYYFSSAHKSMLLQVNLAMSKSKGMAKILRVIGSSTQAKCDVTSI